MTYRCLLLLGILSSFSLEAVQAQLVNPLPSKPKEMPIEITADGPLNGDNDLVTANENVVIHYGPEVLYADKVLYFGKKHEVDAEGNVRLYSNGKVYRGQMIKYNFETHQLDSNEFAIVSYPFVADGTKATTPPDSEVDKEHYRIQNGFFTTDNRQVPAFRLQAHTIEIYPNDQVVLKNATFYVGDVPVAWIPFYVQDLKDQTTSMNFGAGDTSQFGFFLYSNLNWRVNDNLKLTFTLDNREKRGLGGGVDAQYKPTAEGVGIFKSYYTHDDEFTESLSSQPRTPVYANRYRFSLQQRSPFGPDMSTMVNLNVQSDPYITEDFFKKEFAEDRMPDSAVEGVFYNPNFTISVLGREQLNRFYTSVNELPGVTFENKRVKLFGSDFAYEGQTSVINFRKVYSNQNLSGQTPPPVNYGAYRWDTFHQILYPKEYFGWLSVTPRIGGRLTEWSNDNEQSPSDGKNAVGRGLVLVGTEASFKASQSWLDVKNNYLGIDGVRHVLEPFVNFQYIPRPDINPTQLNGFDTRVPNVWAQPINLTAYNSIDSLDREAVLRYGIRNKLQTKRDGLNVDVVDWSLFTDLNFDRHYNEMYQQTDNRLSNVYNDINFKPLPWLTFRSQTALPTAKNAYTMSDNGVTWQATKFYDFTLGDRYLDNVQILDNYGNPIPNSDLIYLRNFYRINEHWQFEARHQFEASSGYLQEQDYTLYRDLSSWQLAMTYSQEDYPDRPSNHTVYLQMTLKAFPDARFSLSQ